MARTLRHDVGSLFFIPSFYGAVTWGAWLALYIMRLIRVDACSAGAMTLFLAVEALFILSVSVSLPHYRDAMQARDRTPAGAVGGPPGNCSSMQTVLILAHVAGISGLVLYVVEFSRNLGGLAGFFLALVNEAYAIRWEAETSASIGTQLSYFGWIAVALTVFLFVKKRLSGYWLVPAFVQFLGNFLFIDRTRPFWILFTSFFMILPAAKGLEARKILKLLVGSSIVAMAIFWAVAEWTGKTGYEGKYEESVLPGITQEFYLYGISGFAYFNRVTQSGEQLSYKPERVLYPGFKLLARLGVTREPPAQILDFYDVPFATNVGTFLEPFYRDGGWLFVLCGIIIYSFGFDLLGLHLLKSGKPLAIYAWSNLCFVTFMGFFTPQATFFPTWLFTGLGVASTGLAYLFPHGFRPAICAESTK